MFLILVGLGMAAAAAGVMGVQDASIPWGKVVRKGGEILLTGIVIGGVDKTLDGGEKGKETTIIQYVTPPPPPPAPAQPARGDLGMGETLMVAGAAILGVGAIGLFCQCLFKKRHARRPVPVPVPADV